MSSLTDLLGTAPRECPHDKDGDTSLVIVVPNEVEDWQHLQAQPWFDPASTAVKVCNDCFHALPSHIQQLADARERNERDRRKVEDAKAEALREAIESGSTLMYCDDCDTYVAEDDLVAVRQCPHCDVAFNFDEHGRNCPECNRPFSRKLLDAGCPNCADDGEAVEVREVDPEAELAKLTEDQR